MLKTELMLSTSAITESITSVQIDSGMGSGMGSRAGTTPGTPTTTGIYPSKSTSTSNSKFSFNNVNPDPNPDPNPDFNLGLFQHSSALPTTVNKEYIYGASAGDIITQEQETMQRYRTLYNKHISMIMRYKDIKLQAKMYRYIQRRLLRYQIQNVVNVTTIDTSIGSNSNTNSYF